MAAQHFDVFVGKEYLKFNAAHFIAYPGFRERLHGHNYHVTVRVTGELGPDGYVLDFGIVKRATKRVCARSHGTSSMSREPPPKTGTRSAADAVSVRSRSSNAAT